ncbi:MAG: glycosyltransferase [Acidobacteriota bacterium]
MKVSVIICTYNRADSLGRTLASLAPGNVPNDCEVIVVDNNSSDHTQQVLREYQERYPVVFKCSIERKRGKAAALNHGIRVSQGEILAFTDDDVVLPANWIEEIVKAVDAHPECDIFGGRVVPVLSEGGSFPDWIHWEDPYNVAEGPLVDHNNGDSVRSYHEFGMCVPVGANFFIRRRAIDKYGYYIENNAGTNDPATAEDSVWSNKAKNAGAAMLYVPTVVVSHVTDERRLSKKFFVQYARTSAKACRANTPGDQDSPCRLFNVPWWFYRKLLNAFGIYMLSLLKGEKESLVFAKQYSVFHMFWIIYEFAKDYKFRFVKPQA